LLEKKDNLFYTEILSERISQFIVNEIQIEEAYTISSVSEYFGIDIRLARYYLMKFVDKGILCQITWDGNTYYALRCWKGPFKELGVKVL
jgi:ribosomal protein S25